MPYNWNGDYVPSAADRTTDILGMKEIGGVGQLIYHPFRFSSYNMFFDGDDYCASPVFEKGKEAVFPTDDTVTGKELLVSLCNLAQQIDNLEEKEPYDRLITKWCIEHMHPYSIDFIYSELTGANFDIEGCDRDFVVKDATFGFREFMEDLGKLYNASRFYVALECIFLAENEPAYHMYKEGRYFEGLPFFETYKSPKVAIPDIDVGSAGGDIIKEMKLYAEYEEKHPAEQPPEGEFAEEPFDDYEVLRDHLIELIPDFNMRLKVNPRTNRMEFTADVNSVFDIAWYTLARLMSEDVSPEDKGKEEKRPEGIMICCKNCGSFLVRRSQRQEYCDSEECQRARKAQNQKDFRKRKSLEKAMKKRNAKK